MAGAIWCKALSLSKIPEKYTFFFITNIQITFPDYHSSNDNSPGYRSVFPAILWGPWGPEARCTCASRTLRAIRSIHSSPRGFGWIELWVHLWSIPPKGAKRRYLTAVMTCLRASAVSAVRLLSICSPFFKHQPLCFPLVTQPSPVLQQVAQVVTLPKALALHNQWNFRSHILQVKISTNKDILNSFFPWPNTVTF